jgi:acetyl-CoA carboxylase carboxyltransferase component
MIAAPAPIRSAVRPASEAFKRNRAEMLALVAELSRLQGEAIAGGGKKYVDRHRHRGKLMAGERISLLLDRESPFLELCVLAGYGTTDPLGGSVRSGIGLVAGVECVIAANDATVKGGAYNPSGVAKIRRAMEISHENRLPLINLVESAGADLSKQTQIFVPGGTLFKQLTRLSEARIPTIAIVFGSSTAGGAYMPGMSDYTVMVKNQARVFLGGPPLVKMATNEEADEESLGGALMHSVTSGSSDYLANDERDALRIGREIVAHLNWRKQGPGPTGPADPPIHDPDELLGVVGGDVRRPLEIREVIARLVDGSRLEEFKPLYGVALVAGWASIHGFPIGILANNGVLFSQEAQKGAQFIQLCNRSDVPILFIQNITGFMVGTKYEQGGIIKDGAKLINTVSNSKVPHLTLMVGASYGAGNYGMAGRAYDPRFVFSWPSHRIAVMGPRQAAGVLALLRGAATGADGAPELSDVERAVETQIERESTAFFASGQLWDDGVLDPRHTRHALGIALSATHSGPIEGTNSFGVFRM